jgi:Zn-dependent metalloprotease
MKARIIIIGISLCISLVSCEQYKAENAYCVNRIHNSLTTIILPQNQIDSIKFLFDYNHLDYTKYQFYSLQDDELGYHHVKCHQFKNNLRLFTNDLIFHFNEKNNYYFLSGELIEKVSLDSRSTMNYDSVVAKFLYALDQDKDFFGDKKIIKNNCFDIEFGYYDLNTGISNASENFAKAWKIKPTNRDYPYAYINDMNSVIIGYDNGIRY